MAKIWPKSREIREKWQKRRATIGKIAKTQKLHLDSHWKIAKIGFLQNRDFFTWGGPPNPENREFHPESQGTAIFSPFFAIFGGF